MFANIFKYELRHQFRRPTIYLYLALFFLIGFGGMAMSADILGEQKIEQGNELFANAPISIFTFFKDINLFILILLPTIFGHSIYRDFQSKMHTILYSFPFQKKEYLAAKFISALLVMTVIVGAVGVGLFIGENLPWINPSLVGETNFGGYFQAYLGYVLPNILIFGSIVFAVVAVTRNIYAGLATVVMLILFRGMIGSFLGGIDNQFWAAVFDPYGEAAMKYGLKYWTLNEQNSMLLPLGKPIILNRFFWLAIASMILFWCYQRFELEQDAHTFGFKKISKKGASKESIGKVTKIELPKVAFDFSFFQQIKTTWELSNIETKFIFTSRTFLLVLAASFVFMFVLLSQVNPDYTTRIHPLTNVMLFIPTFFFSMVISILTFLYAGILIHRTRTGQMNQLVDVTPVSDWSQLISKFIALVKMQIALLAVIMIVGIFVQVMRGYYNFEIGLYLFDLYCKVLPGFIIWAMLALFVQSVVSNPMLGTFALVMILFGIAGLESFGIKNALFRFNESAPIVYSDMDGYGGQLTGFYLYKLYWFLGGSLFLIGAYLFTTRGLTFSFSERLSDAKDRFRSGGQIRRKIVWAFALPAILFIALGSFIFIEQNEGESSFSKEEILKNKYEAEIKYSKFKNTIQPRVSGAKINMHLFPKTRDYQSDGEFILKNKSNQIIDTVLVNTSFEDITEVRLNRESERIISDSIVHFQVFKLKTSLPPGDSLKLFFNMKNKPNGIFNNQSQIAENGTFYVPNFPSIGAPDYEITNVEKRKEFGLPQREGMALPPKFTADHSSSEAENGSIENQSSILRSSVLDSARTTVQSDPLANYYAGNNIDFINFEATVSTAADQIALAPGKLQKEWTEGNRRFFKYKTKNPIRNGIVFNSGRFAVKKDKWRDIDLEIYYHPAHDFNLESMMNGMKATLEYCTENFAPYQFRQMRIVEFPKTYGNFAQSFAGTIPYSEFAGFITNVDSSAQNRYDSPFRLTTHEMSHQWWGHQIVPANVRGSKVVTEGLAEYTSLKILEKSYGKERMRIFLKLSRDAYLKGRSREDDLEQPLWCAHHGQNYLNYNKGAVALYALSDYLGEKVFNKMLITYVENFRLQSSPYPTSVDLVEVFHSGTPDSLQYLIDDLFEASILYDNRVVDAKLTEMEGGKYQIEMNFIVSKYQSGKGGKRIFSKSGNASIAYQPNDSDKPIESLPLADYVEVGIFNKKGEEIYIRKHKITEIKNQISVVIDELPREVGIDPWLKLIDVKGEDNRLKIK